MKKEKPQVTTEQMPVLKTIFFFFCGLALLFSWLMYYSWTRNGNWYLLWAALYFYNCNIATNIRELIEWPLYKTGD